MVTVSAANQFGVKPPFYRPLRRKAAFALNGLPIVARSVPNDFTLPRDNAEAELMTSLSGH